jgi:hypothetical protein
MHSVIRRSNRLQKNKLGVTCASNLFLESIPVPHEHEKKSDHISRPGRTGMHYVTRRSHRIQMHKFGVTCPDTLFMESAPDPPEHEN